MISLTRFLAVPASVIAIFFLLLGCGESEVVHPTEPHSEHDGHDHSEEPDSHEGHEHNEAEPDDTGEMASHGSIEIAGTTFSVSLTRDIQPSSAVNLDLEVQAGPIPTAIRFWIGDEAGTGALKSKTDAHDDHFHGQTESPTELTGASLWIETETADGNRHTKSVSLD